MTRATDEMRSPNWNRRGGSAVVRGFQEERRVEVRQHHPNRRARGDGGGTSAGDRDGGRESRGVRWRGRRVVSGRASAGGRGNLHLGGDLSAGRRRRGGAALLPLPGERHPLADAL